MLAELQLMFLGRRHRPPNTDHCFEHNVTAYLQPFSCASQQASLGYTLAGEDSAASLGRTPRARYEEPHKPQALIPRPHGGRGTLRGPRREPAPDGSLPPVKAYQHGGKQAASAPCGGEMPAAAALLAARPSLTAVLRQGLVLVNQQRPAEPFTFLVNFLAGVAAHLAGVEPQEAADINGTGRLRRSSALP